MATTETHTEVKTEHVMEEIHEPLRYKTWVLKVSIHCEGCKRKIKKLLTNTDGVYTTNIDMRQQKVVVIGDVEAETLIKKIIKAGRHAELWAGTATHKEKKSRKPKKESDGDDDDESSEEEDDNNGGSGGGAVGVAVGGGGGGGGGNNCTGELIIESEPEVKQVTFVSGGQPPATNMAESGVGGGDGGGAKKKKKKKRKKKSSGSTNSNNTNITTNNTNNNNINNVSEGPPPKDAPTGIIYASPSDPCPQQPHPTHHSPPRHHWSPHPSHYQAPPPSYYHHAPPRPSYYQAPPPTYTVSYNTAHPGSGVYGTSHYTAPPSHYSYEYVHPEAGSESPPSDFDSYSSQPSNSFELFSEANPNACSMM